MLDTLKKWLGKKPERRDLRVNLRHPVTASVLFHPNVPGMSMAKVSNIGRGGMAFHHMGRLPKDIKVNVVMSGTLSLGSDGEPIPCNLLVRYIKLATHKEHTMVGVQFQQINVTQVQHIIDAVTNQEVEGTALADFDHFDTDPANSD